MNDTTEKTTNPIKEPEKLPEELKMINLAGAEERREYRWGVKGRYRIADPDKVYYRDGGSTHRVADKSGFVFIVPAPGHFDCYIMIRGKVIA